MIRLLVTHCVYWLVMITVFKIKQFEDKIFDGARACTLTGQGSNFYANKSLKILINWGH